MKTVYTQIKIKIKINKLLYKTSTCLFTKLKKVMILYRCIYNNNKQKNKNSDNAGYLSNTDCTKSLWIQEFMS